MKGPTRMNTLGSDRARLKPKAHILEALYYTLPPGAHTHGPGGKDWITHTRIWAAGPSTWGQAEELGQSHSMQPGLEAVREKTQSQGWQQGK